MNLFFWKNKKKKNNLQEKQNNNKKMKAFIVKTIGLISKNIFIRDEFEAPNYDFEEIKIASEKDSYIRESFLKHNYLIYKAGYTLKGEDEIVDYIKKRFRIMSFSTGTPVDVLFQQVGDDLIKYSNAFLVKARIDANDLPKNIRATPAFSDKIVGGYFRIDPCTVRIKRDKYGTIKKYQQVVNGETKDFKPEDVVHFYLNKEAGEAFGTPRIVAALEDVKLLRKIEGIVITLIYRFAIPVYQWKVGIPEAGFQATDAEIDDTREEIENMSLDGVIVTNERTDIKAIGAEKVALDASEYLKYFEKRVFTALNVSEAQMGRGGSKQDADSMEAQMHDTIKFIQKNMSIFIENYILSELLLEGGYDPIFNESHIVKYEFNEISLETKVKLENHEMLKFQSNVITHEELRHNIGLKEICNEERLYNNMIVNKSILEQIEAKEKSNGNVGGNGKEVEQKPNEDVETRNKPKNQHGEFSAKIKEEADNKIKNDSKQKNKRKYKTIYSSYNAIRNDIIKFNDKSLDILFSAGKTLLVDAFNDSLLASSQYGITHAVSELKKHETNVSIQDIDLSEIQNNMTNDIDKLLKDIYKNIKNDRSAKNVRLVFSIFEYRIRYMIEYHFRKAYWYSFVMTGKNSGIAKAYIDFGDSKDKDNHNSVLSLNKFTLDDIPAFHSFCSCTVSFTK